MPIRNSSVPVGATFAPSGGSATNLTVLSQEAGKIVSFVASSGVLVNNRTEVNFASTLPKPQTGTPGGFTQARSAVTIKTPKVLANLNRTINTARVEIAFDPETSAAEISAMKSLLINLINDTDFDAFWANQSVD